MAPANLDGCRLLDKELGDECGGYQLRGDGGPGGAFDSPVELHNEHEVENDVRHRTDDFAEHGGLGVAHGADEVVHAGGDCLKNRTAQKNAHVAAGHGQGLLAGAEQLQERHHENFTQGKGADGHQDQKRERVVQDNACLNVLLLTETNGE